MGYVTLRFPGTSPDNYGRDVGLPKGELQSVGQLDGGAVHPRARQMGLYQHLLVRRMRLARILGYHHLTAVVSPLNPPSLSSQLQIGLRVVGIQVDQDGPIFLLHADSRARSMEPERPAARVLIGDFEAHRAALDQGLVGIRLERARESHTLIYGHSRSRAVSSPSE